MKYRKLRIAWSVAWATCGVCMVGCDPVRTTTQTARVVITDSQSGKPIAGLRIRAKYDFDRGQSKSNSQVSEDARRHAREFWTTLPWSAAMTDNNGEAEFMVETTKLDRNGSNSPSSTRDEITEQPYLIKIGNDSADVEELSVVMSPDDSVKGKQYVVTVVAVGTPSYVRTRE